MDWPGDPQYWYSWFSILSIINKKLNYLKWQNDAAQTKLDLIQATENQILSIVKTLAEPPVASHLSISLGKPQNKP